MVASVGVPAGMDAAGGATTGDVDMEDVAAAAGASGHDAGRASVPATAPGAVGGEQRNEGVQMQQQAAPSAGVPQPWSNETKREAAPPAAAGAAPAPQRPPPAAAPQVPQAAALVSPASVGAPSVLGRTPAGQSAVVQSPVPAGEDGGDGSAVPPNPFQQSDVKWW